MKYLKYLVFLGLLFLPIYTQALEATPKITCDKTLLSVNESTTCQVEINVQSGGVKEMTASIDVSSNLETGSKEMSFQSASDTIETGTLILGTFVVTARTVVPETNETIKVTGIKVQDENNTEVTFDDISYTIRIPSTNASLQTLTVDNGTLSPAFDPNITTYQVNDVNSSTIIINATGNSNASITGIGKKNLSYGGNIFSITVKAESGATKTYTITVNRVDNRSSDTTLKNITVKNGVLDSNNQVIFPSSIDTFFVEATPNDSNAKVTYSANNVKLSLDETYTIFIYVTAENGKKATYLVTATRKDERSSNNSLKSISINNKEINLNQSQSYTMTVNNDVTTANLLAVSEDEKAQVEITGSKNLKVGSNVFSIVVTAENEAIKTYKVTVIRKNSEGDITNLSNNSYLKKLEIKEAIIDFSKEKLEYALEVESNISNLTITYEVEDKKATVLVEKPEELKIGLNEIHVIVTAENGETSDYVLKVTRKEKNYIVENKESTILKAIKDAYYDEVIVKVNDKEDLVISKSILNTIADKKKKITYQVIVQERIEYSVSVDGNLFGKQEKDFFYGLSFESDIEKLHEILGEQKVIILNFLSDDSLLTGTTFKVYVGNIYSDNSSLYLYSYDEIEQNLVFVQENLEVIDGYVTLSLEHLSTYTLLDKKIEEEKFESSDNKPASSAFPSIYIYLLGGGVGFLLIVLIIILIIRKKKKNKNEEIPFKDETDNTLPIQDMPLPIDSNVSEEPTNLVTEDTIIIDLEEPIAEHMELLFGISAMDINDYLEKCPLADLKNNGIDKGIVIVGFEPDSILEKAGLHQGDVLLEMDHQKITNKEQFRSLVSSLGRGKEVEFIYYRNGEEKQIKVLV